MKKLLPFTFLLLILFLTSCDNEPDCFDGTVRFTNTSANPYYLYIDDVFELELSGNSFIERDLLEGQHTARAEQVSGFILFPTIRETTLSVFGCKETEWVFP